MPAKQDAHCLTAALGAAARVYLREASLRGCLGGGGEACLRHALVTVSRTLAWYYSYISVFLGVHQCHGYQMFNSVTPGPEAVVRIRDEDTSCATPLRHAILPWTKSTRPTKIGDGEVRDTKTNVHVLHQNVQRLRTTGALIDALQHRRHLRLADRLQNLDNGREMNFLLK